MVKACGYLSETQGGGAVGRHGKIVLDMEGRLYIGLATQAGFVLQVELELILEGWKMIQGGLRSGQQRQGQLDT